ncbi:hypothetical protein LVJ83_09145 [Uruburuella testudinis]|uniref:Lipoprotein n=1 Tax=Uruburuella testudinis TaxID=1282863 RepID=A0ABY4DWT0_9NEIS|nr:hypothetical protein [Uruburuella testudinis]UOO81141.1 hypothetical protein LVJ83_09145 [Uruburuella testudinis]
MPTVLHFSAWLAGLALLAGCGEQKQQFQQAFDEKYRSEFITSFTKQCISSIPAHVRMPETQKQQLCQCSAEKAVEVVSATEIAQAITGNIDEALQEKVTTAARPCLEALAAQAASNPQ